jgi:hypothetical protein
MSQANLIRPEETASRAIEQEAAAITPLQMLDRAIASGADMEVLTKLMDLYERWQANQARRAFNEAIAAAKAEIPVIIKNREVDFISQKGRTHYRYEDFAGIARVIDPILAKHGLSYRFRTTAANGVLTVTCVLSHVAGYAEENSLPASYDETGNKNPIQTIGSTQTYLQRYTLKAALGLAASDDDDGRAAAAAETISPEQVAELQDLIAAYGAPKEKFLKYLKIESLVELPAAQFAEAKAALERWKAGQATQAKKATP